MIVETKKTFILNNFLKSTIIQEDIARGHKFRLIVNNRLLANTNN